MGAWVDLPGEFLAGVDAACPSDADTVSHMRRLGSIRAGESYLAWCRYQTILVLCDRLLTPTGSSYVSDGFGDIVARVAREAGITRYRASVMVDDALCLRSRLPRVLETLRDGIIAPHQVRDIISRTNLVHDDHRLDPVDPDSPRIIEVLDASIAEVLRNRVGSWSTAGLRDMIDRLVFGHDADAVRERRREALDKRGVWTENHGDGTAEITAVMAAENVRACDGAVRALAATVCDRDGRTLGQRRSDAMLALLTRSVFTCRCGENDCTATAPDGSAGAAASTQIVIHVVTDADTLAGGAGPGWVDGHGVISDEHVHDLAARPDAILVPVTPVRTPPARVAADGSVPTPGRREEDETTMGANVRAPQQDTSSTGRSGPVGDSTMRDAASSKVVVIFPGAQAADPYRPTTACAEFVRVRDGYCTEPGCTRSAFTADVDHVAEFDHARPARGGATSSENLNVKCRAGHLHKTHGDWTDTQYRDHEGRLVTEYVTPEGFVIPGEAETLEDIFPNLRRIRFEQAAKAPPTPRLIVPEHHPRPPRTISERTAAKHAKRRAERARNTARREANRRARAEAPHHQQTTRQDDGPPPF
ncbi:HNH endonuclease signature motif containing protein [Gordonia sp. 'Campus']|uniref:HNH endonuclease signature motif containing protein n=1 Tax=Gordonia sp. 'Campus' TaxID=2915824 RepID=UPI001EE3EF66|nr:HNH endonuclease signature motif containing protein [Gordonia sp. 'Campus']